MKNENHGFGKLAGLNPHKYLQSDVAKVWEQMELILAWLVHSKVHDFGVLALFCDLVMCGVKNENHGFGKLAGLNPHKCLQSDVAKVWEQVELILAWLVHSKVHDFRVLALFCDLVVCGVKNENHGFGKLAGLWLVHSQVHDFGVLA